MLVVSLAITSLTHAEADCIKTSVPPEHTNGQQTKLITAISEKLGCTLQIAPMPFARRLQKLKTGEIDIASGLLRKPEREEYIHFVSPPFGYAKTVFFVRKGDEARITRWEDLYSLRVGTTIGAKYFSRFDNDQRIQRTAVASQEQLVKMLLKERIDAFILLKGGGLKTIARLNVKDRIAIATFQPDKGKLGYVGISKNSPLMKKKDEISKALKEILKSRKCPENTKCIHKSSASAAEL